MFPSFKMPCTKTTDSNGRLGNQIIRNVAVHLIAQKHDLFVDYSSRDLMSKLGISLHCGTNQYDETVSLTDDNFFPLLSQPNLLHANLDPNSHYFQTEEIIHVIYQYLHKNEVKQRVIMSNPFKNRYLRNNDLFVHVRLTDAAQWTPGVDYYLNLIDSIPFDNLFIASDDPTHDCVKSLLLQYPFKSKVMLVDEVLTMQFASTCKNVVLSHGTFSSVIGYLSYFSTIYYPETTNLWHGDIFSIPSWIQCRTKRKIAPARQHRTLTF